MNREQYETQYEIILNRAYELYKKDWCAVRNFPYEEVCRADTNDEEYNGQMYVCKAEFEDCEFQVVDYMKSLLSEEDFWCYEKVMAYFK